MYYISVTPQKIQEEIGILPPDLTICTWDIGGGTPTEAIIFYGGCFVQSKALNQHTY